MQIVSCRYCHKEFSVERSGDYQCPHCLQRQSFEIEGSGIVGGTQVTSSNPWENRSTTGFIPALQETWLGVCTDTEKFFRSLVPGQKLADAILFGTIVASIGGVFGAVYSAFYQQKFSSLMTALVPKLGQTSKLSGEMSAIGLIVQILFVPVAVVVTIAVSSLITHLCLMIVGGDKKGFATTFQVVSYAQAVSVLFVVPILGPLVAFVWKIFILVVGLRETHQISTTKAAIAVLAPLILCISCCGAGFIAALAVGLSSLKTAMLAMF